MTAETNTNESLYALWMSEPVMKDVSRRLALAGIENDFTELLIVMQMEYQQFTRSEHNALHRMGLTPRQGIEMMTKNVLDYAMRQARSEFVTHQDWLDQLERTPDPIDNPVYVATRRHPIQETRCFMPDE